jgi:hypothetical protein
MADFPLAELADVLAPCASAVAETIRATATMRKEIFRNLTGSPALFRE